VVTEGGHLFFGSREWRKRGIKGNCPALLWRMRYESILSDGGAFWWDHARAHTRPRTAGIVQGWRRRYIIFALWVQPFLFFRVLFFGAEALGLRVATLTDSCAASLLCARHFYV
jgi:hypothetical protein